MPVVLAVCLISAGCVDHGETLYPPSTDMDTLPAGQATIHECLVATDGTDLLLGDIIGPAGAPLTIDSVVADGLSGLRVLGIYLLDPADGTPIATATEIPESDPIWVNRVPVEGAALKQGDVRNLVVHAIVDDETAAKLDDLSITYTVNGQSAAVATRRSFEVAPECD